MTTLCISSWTLKLPSGSFRDFIAPFFSWLFSYNLLHKLSGFGCSTLQRAEFYSYLSNSSDSLGFVFTMMIILAQKNLHLTAMSHLWLTQPVSSKSSEPGHRSLKSLVGCKLLPKQQPGWVRAAQRAAVVLSLAHNTAAAFLGWDDTGSAKNGGVNSSAMPLKSSWQQEECEQILPSLETGNNQCHSNEVVWEALQRAEEWQKHRKGEKGGFETNCWEQKCHTELGWWCVRAHHQGQGQGRWAAQ